MSAWAVHGVCPGAVACLLAGAAGAFVLDPVLLDPVLSDPVLSDSTIPFVSDALAAVEPPAESVAGPADCVVPQAVKAKAEDRSRTAPAARTFTVDPICWLLSPYETPTANNGSLFHLCSASLLMFTLG